MSIDVRGIVKQFTGGASGLNDVSFTVKSGELIGFLGPSGSGKTTMLRIIAGLERQTRGEVYIDGESVDDMPPQRRGIGFVFQNYALFKHMTVFENIAFGLAVQKKRREEIRSRVIDLLDLVRLSGFENRYPDQLSGGQAQRVALARALAPKPRVLLLDEPFAAIDTQVRRELRQWVRQVHDEVGITSIFVTHDQEEALETSDRVLVMNAGKVEQFDTPEEIYQSPRNVFVANFVGEANHFMRPVQFGRVSIGKIHVEASDIGNGRDVHVVIRPFDVQLRPVQSDVDIVGEVVRTSYKGHWTSVEVQLNDEVRLHAYITKEQHLTLDVGSKVAITIRDYRLFAAN